LGDTVIKAQWEDGVNSEMCKKPSTFTFVNVIERNVCIYYVDNNKESNQKNRK